MHESTEAFTSRLCKDLGCFYHQNETNYSLKKDNHRVRGQMRVFGWVTEKKRVGKFAVSTYRHLADTTSVQAADKVKSGAHYVSKNNDDGRATGLTYYVEYGSSSLDYQKAVKALITISKNR